MSFGFGTPTTTTTSAFGFGAKSSTPAFALGNVTTTTTATLFGTPQQANATGLSFGRTSATQNVGLFATGTPTQTTGLTFGTPTATAPAAQVTGFAFGTQAPTNLSFGTPSSQQPTLSYGTPASTAQTTIGFGTPSATTQGGLTLGSTPLFGAPTSVAPVQFGTPATTSQPTLSFGTTASTPASTGSLFASAQPMASVAALPALGTGGFGFGALSSAAATTGSTTFKTVVSATGAPITAFPTPVSFGASLIGTTTASTLFSTPTTTSTALGLSIATSKPLGLFATPSTATTSGLTLPSFNSSTTTTSSLFSAFSKPITTVAATTISVPSIGLGGLDTTQSKGLASTLTGSIASRGESKTVKESAVPNELLQTVDGFKDFVKKQKAYCSDIARSSPKTMHKVQEDIELLKQMLASVVSDLQRNVTLSSRLKADTDKCLQTVEMAQKTHDTPPGLQFENTAPDKYFEDLVTNFENQIQVFKQEVDKIEAHVNAVLTPRPLNSQELCLALKRLVDCFVALAGRLHTVHNMVENQKEQYLNLRRYFLKDTTNIFEEDPKKSPSITKAKTPVTVSTGPTAFSALGNQGIGIMSSAISKAQLPSNNPLGWGSSQQQSSSFQLQQPHQPFLSSGFGTSIFSGGVASNINTLSTPPPVENQNFQLQKPPVGNKRGKRI